jgi:hypothetical protein
LESSWTALAIFFLFVWISYLTIFIIFGLNSE